MPPQESREERIRRKSSRLRAHRARLKRLMDAKDRGELEEVPEADARSVSDAELEGSLRGRIRRGIRGAARGAAGVAGGVGGQVGGVDPDRGRPPGRPPREDGGMFALAAQNTAMGPPVDADLTPLTAPEQTGAVAAASAQPGRQGGMAVDELVYADPDPDGSMDLDDDTYADTLFGESVEAEMQYWFGGDR